MSFYSQFYILVAGAVRRNRLLGKPSNAEVEQEIKVWLRQSGDCGGGRQVRERLTTSHKRMNVHKSRYNNHSSEDGVEM